MLLIYHSENVNWLKMNSIPYSFARLRPLMNTRSFLHRYDFVDDRDRNHSTKIYIEYIKIESSYGSLAGIRTRTHIK